MGQGGLVSRSIMGIAGGIMWLIGLYVDLLSPRDPPSRRGCKISVHVFFLGTFCRSLGFTASVTWFSRTGKRQTLTPDAFSSLRLQAGVGAPS